jgi:hypothetical protein
MRLKMFSKSDIFGTGGRTATGAFPFFDKQFSK